MKIEVVDYNSHKIVKPTGDIDMYTSPELRKQLLGLINKKIPVLFVDLNGVSYIDSSGIATFVEGLKGMKSYGGRLKLVGMPKGILEIFSFSKLDKVFEIYPTMDEAGDK